MSGFPGHLKGVSASSLGWQNLPGQATIAQNARGCREGGSPGHSVLAVGCIMMTKEGVWGHHHFLAGRLNGITQCVLFT